MMNKRKTVILIIIILGAVLLFLIFRGCAMPRTYMNQPAQETATITPSDVSVREDENPGVALLPSAIQTAEATAMPKAAEQLQPTKQPMESEKPAAESTLAPTEKSAATSKPAVSSKPTATPTPAPDPPKAPEVIPEPMPVSTPQPTSSPVPTPVPEPTPYTARTICNTCGADITDNVPAHGDSHLLNGEDFSYRNE